MWEGPLCPDSWLSPPHVATQRSLPHLRQLNPAPGDVINTVAKRNKPSGLTLLGKSEARLPASPAEARLETFPNPAKRNYRIRFETADFTSLCPVTGQVDFAQITIEYVPAKL